MASSIALNTGAKMPIIGLGTWLSKPQEVREAVETAVRAGYRHIDTAWGYRNEAEIGEALKNLFAAGTVKREDLFVVTKLHGYFHAKDKVEEGLRDSLRKLGLGYVDLYLVHTPLAMERQADNPNAVLPLKDGKLICAIVDHVETWKGMEEVYKKGLARSIGLSNFTQKQIQYIWDHATVKPANLQVECHAHWPQSELHDFCKKLGISFTAYAPIGSPGRFIDPADGDPVLMEDGVVVGLAEKYKKFPAQILLRWLIQREIIVIPKSVNPQRILENFQIWDFHLEDDDFRALCGLKKGRLFKVKVGKDHPDYPFHD